MRRATLLCRPLFIIIGISGAIFFAGSKSSESKSDRGGASPADTNNTIGYLSQVMDQFHDSIDVYSDCNAAGNHFLVLARMSSESDEDAVPVMDEASIISPHSGVNCIKASFKSKGQNWGGWYFMNGILDADSIVPEQNWGDYPNAGIDLSGATKLSFWAKGERGGERVEFFCLGIGRDPDTGFPIKSYPDSSKISTGYVTLTAAWRQFTLDVSETDLSYVLGGFGWVTSSDRNSDQDITFYIDDIKYDKPLLDQPRFLVSYQTAGVDTGFDKIARNTAFVYDNMLAVLAYLANGNSSRAQLILDALLYAQENDRYYNDGRIRNAYQGGDLSLPPGWILNDKINTVRLPGWYDNEINRWSEDYYQISTHTGTVAWAILALMTYYETNGGEQYLASAAKLANWVEINCRGDGGKGGYTAGFEGWEPNPTKLTYRSTEHNIALYAAFYHLYLATGMEVWYDRADSARHFVLRMWDNNQNKFWIGTKPDGSEINTDHIPLDVQSLTILALEEGRLYWKTAEFAEENHKIGEGYDFDTDLDGIWFEGTSQMANAYLEMGDREKREATLNFLQTSQDSSGGLAESNKDGLTTGIYLSNGQHLQYYNRIHTGTTAWLALSQSGSNPFWMKKGKNYRKGDLITKPLPAGTESEISFNFDDGSNFNLKFVDGNTQDADLAMTYYGREVPDELQNIIQVSENVVSLWNIRLVNMPEPFLVQCTFDYRDSLINALGIKEDSLIVSYWDETKNKWSPINTQIDTTQNQAIIEVNHLSVLALTENDSLMTDVAENESQVPFVFNLYQNFPNPFNLSTTIRYQIPHPSLVTVKIFNILGQEIRSLLNSFKEEGIHQIQWDGRNNENIIVPSGVYLYRVQAGTFSQARKMILVK